MFHCRSGFTAGFKTVAGNGQFQVVAVFLIFLTTRVFVLLNHVIPFVTVGMYGDAYAYYVPAGVAYVSGSLPDSINPEHPPLAKYIIGLFAVYLHDASAASLLFGLLTAVVVFLMVKKLNPTGSWAPAVAVWLLSFDPINIGLSVYPMLDGFMIFFAVLSVYMLLLAKKSQQYALVGVVIGLAVACKWTAFFFAVPEILYLIVCRRFLSALKVMGAGGAGYVLAYIPLILGKGFVYFIGLQVWMLGFMVNAHGPTGNGSLFANLVAFVIFHITTFAPVTGYDPGFHPEAVRLLERYYISLADMINPLITLAIFPVLYDQIKRHLTCQEKARLLLLLVLGGAIVGEVIFPISIVTWYDAPLIILTCIFAADSLYVHKRSRRSIGFYLYLTLVATWLILATAIVFLRMAYYRTFSGSSGV